MTASREHRLRQLSELVIRYRFVLLTVAVVCVAIAWPEAQRLAFDQSIESLYARNDPHLRDFLESKRLFGGDEFAMVAWTEPDLFVSPSAQRDADGESASATDNADGTTETEKTSQGASSGSGGKPVQLNDEAVQRIRELAEELNAVPGVRSDSTQHLAKALKFPYRRRKVRELVEGILVGEDDRTTAIVLRLADEKRTSIPRAATIRRIREIAREFGHRHELPQTEGGRSVFVVGEPVQIHDMFRYVEEDGRTLFRVSLILLAGVIFLLFRSVRWVTLPLLVVIAALVWTKAILVVSGLRLSMVSSMLNSLVTIIGIATVTHVAVHYRRYGHGHTPMQALARTAVNLSRPVFWTCLTTAVGFAALLSSSVTPVQSFSLMVALGVLLVPVAAVLLLPGGVLLWKNEGSATSPRIEERFVAGLDRLARWVVAHPGTVSLAGLVVAAAAGAGLYRLKVETSIIRNFRESSPIVRSVEFVESRLGGAGTWEVNFPLEDLNDRQLERVRKLTRRLREEFVHGDRRLTKIASVTDALDLVPREIDYLFGKKTLSLQTRLNMLDRFQPDFLETVYNADEGRMRIMLRAREQQSAGSRIRLIRDVEAAAREQFPEAETTGLFVLLTFLIDNLLRDQLLSFSLAAAGVTLMLMLAFRSLRVGLVSLVPNLFPIVLVVGVMGWIGLPINIATAMIASISMGLTVDGTIHYIAGYDRERSRGRDFTGAIRETHQSVGRAIVFANIALIAGFLVLTLSHFIPLVYFGILVSVAMLGGLAADLVLMPLLLQWIGRKNSLSQKEATAEVAEGAEV